MNHVKFTVALSVCLFLSACGGTNSDAKKAVLRSLKDPDSAKFGKFTLVDDKNACLTVNAKNSMGGYTGDQQAYLTKMNKEWVCVTIEDTSHETCVEVTKRTARR